MSRSFSRGLNLNLLAVVMFCLTTPIALAGVGREIVHIDLVWWSPSQGKYVSARSDLLLLNDLAPNTVANFKAYIAAGLYDATVIHRSAHFTDGAPFVVQGGGFYIDEVGGIPTPTEVPSLGAIPSEWNPDVMSNTRGMVSMARAGTNANSADSQWFINMSSANTFLDYRDNPNVLGFTTFARIIDADTTGQGINNGMSLWDSVAALPTYDFWWLESAFQDLPLVNFSAAEYNAGYDPHFGNYLYTFMTLNQTVLIGDVSGDGLVSTEDINPFIAALTNPDAPYNINADMNQDGLINTEDINPFISMLTTSPPTIVSSIVPEPVTAGLLLAGLVGVLGRRR